MPMAYADRRARLRRVLAGRGEAADPHPPVDAALITGLVNVAYLTGVESSNAALLVPVEEDGSGVLLATDARYAPEAREAAPDLDIVVERKVAPALLQRAVDRGARRVAFEAHLVTVEQHASWTGDVTDLELVPLGHAVEELRTVKDADELALLERAGAISAAALRDLLDGRAGGGVAGRTERQLARALEQHMLDHGADAAAFPSIVAGGPHSAVPHHRATDRPLAPGDLLKLDFGARLEGYHADMTRTVVVGGPGCSSPAAWQRELHELVVTAQRAGRAALAPGADVQDVDAAARRVVAVAGCADYFPHGLGHGVGLQVHEAPIMGYGATGRLAAGTPITVEPGVYLPGRGGVRIEDIVVVPDSAGDVPRVLTIASRDLRLVD